jgi:hypothetical protein
LFWLAYVLLLFSSFLCIILFVFLSFVSSFHLSSHVQAAGGPVRVEFGVPNEPHCKVGQGPQATVCWNGLDNIVARLVPLREGVYNHSDNTILLSCHYDTVTMSPGAYDDSTGVAAMLELVSMASLFCCQLFSIRDGLGLLPFLW